MQYVQPEKGVVHGLFLHWHITFAGMFCPVPSAHGSHWADDVFQQAESW